MTAEKKTRFVVIGANGPIGATFCRALKAGGQEVLEASHAPGPTQLGYDFLVDAPEKLNLDYKFEYVFVLCSGYSNLADCHRHPDISHRFNVAAPQALLAYARNFNVVPVFLSSDNVFDGAKNGYDETASPNPLNLYGKQKLAVEEFIRTQFARHLILRSSKVMGYTSESWVVRQLNELTEHRQILCFTDRHYAPVVIENIPEFVMKAIELGGSGTFHMAQDALTTPFEIMSTIVHALHLPSEPVVPGVMADVKFVEPHPPHTYLLNGKAKRLTGMSFTSMEGYVSELVHRYQSGELAGAGNFQIKG
jgi:dTDP-4-dehydrorhamnose reductase